MKTKKYKTAAHKRMYGIEVACKATSRKLMCGASTEAEGMALTVSHAMKVDVEYLAKDICDATTATETDVKLVWDAMSERIVEALSHGYRVELAGLGTLNMELSSRIASIPLLFKIGEFTVWVKTRNAFLNRGFLPSDDTKLVQGERKSKFICIFPSRSLI